MKWSLTPYEQKLLFESVSRFLSLFYYFDVDAFDNSRSNGLQINHNVKMIKNDHNRHNIIKDYI